MYANPFDDPGMTSGYEAWYETAGRRADRLEKALLVGPRREGTRRVPLA